MNLARVSTMAAALLMAPLPAKAVELIPGVVVDPAKGRLFLMRPDSAVEAVGVSSGKTLWMTRAAAKPLAVSDGMVLSQTEQPRENQLNLVVLDAEGGKPVMQDKISLPAGVIPRITNTMTERFSARSFVVGGEFYVSWAHQALLPRGERPTDEDSAVPPPARGGQRSTGAFKLNAVTKDLRVLAPADLPRIPQSTEVAKLMSTTPGAPSTRRLSADGRHTAAAVRVADDRTWDKYRWTLFDNKTGKEIGEISSHLAQAPFMVVDSVVVFETAPYSRRVDQRVEDEPLKVRAVDLKSHRELWSRPVRDTAYRGPLPP